MNITPYVFENNPVRTLVVENDPWFVGKDVASTLGYKNTKDALSRHVDQEDKRVVAFPDHLQNMQKTTIINESGLYSLILRSKLESAKRFKRWVTSEVLPSIRKAGSYSMQVPQNYSEALRVAADLADEKERLQGQLQAAQPAVDFVEQSVKTESTFSFGEVAKMLNLKTPDGRAIGRNLLIEGLHNIRALMKQGKHNVPLQEHVNAGRFEVKYSIVEIGGAEVSVPRTRVTSRGIQWIRRKFVNGGCEPVLTRVK